jgi:hypothetical protein
VLVPAHQPQRFPSDIPGSSPTVAPELRGLSASQGQCPFGRDLGLVTPRPTSSKGRGCDLSAAGARRREKPGGSSSRTSGGGEIRTARGRRDRQRRNTRICRLFRHFGRERTTRRHARNVPRRPGKALLTRNGSGFSAPVRRARARADRRDNPGKVTEPPIIRRGFAPLPSPPWCAADRLHARSQATRPAVVAALRR